MDNNIFTKISDEKQKNQLYEALLARKGDLICKGQGDDLLKLQVKRYSGSVLRCMLDSSSKPPSLVKDKVICSFTLDTEKYFFYSILHQLEESIYELNTGSDLYKLQRRQSYRIRIPPSYKTKVSISVLDSPNAKAMEGTVIDISTGGSKVVMPFDQPAYQLEQNITAQFNIGPREPISVQAKIRHVKPEAKPKPHQQLGLQFEFVSPALETKLFAVTMELHRELFAKISG